MSIKQNGSRLFIKNASLNLEMEHGYAPEMGDGLDIAKLHKDGGTSFSYQS